MQEWKAPPGRTSSSRKRIVQPGGANQRTRCAGSVQASNTSALGASKSRVMRTDASLRSVTDSLPLADMLGLLGLQLAEVALQAVESRVPEFAVLLHPRGD